MGMFDSFDINASGLTAQRFRMDVISQNIANSNTTRTADGTPYVRKIVTFSEKGNSLSDMTGEDFSSTLQKASKKFTGSGVIVDGVSNDTETAMKKVYEPSNPDANQDGYVTYPNVDTVTEMTDLIDASRSYEANATAFDASKSMALKGLNMGQS
jgi:flagellar basal-body rod protein FlgC